MLETVQTEDAEMLMRTQPRWGSSIRAASVRQGDGMGWSKKGSRAGGAVGIIVENAGAMGWEWSKNVSAKKGLLESR